MISTFFGDDKNMHQVRRWHTREDVTDHRAARGPLAIITVLPVPISAAREQGGEWIKKQTGWLGRY